MQLHVCKYRILILLSCLCCSGQQLVLAEGSRGSLAEFAKSRFGLVKRSCPQRYAIGLKEVWEIDSRNHRNGHVFHSVGWPLNHRTFGGGFLYHHLGQSNRYLVHVGLVVGLDYENPWIRYVEIATVGHCSMKTCIVFWDMGLNGGRRR